MWCSMKVICKKLIFILFLVLLAFGLHSYQFSVKQEEQQYSKIETDAEVLDKLVKGDPVAGLSFTSFGEVDYQNTAIYQKYLNACATNENVIGWITFDNLQIDYPIMKTQDNQFYLDHDWNGEEDKNGAIFMDASENGKWGKLNLIHGHNMKSGNMFGTLQNYKDEDFARNNLNFTVAYKNNVCNFTIFSVIINDNTLDSVQESFSSENDFLTYYNLLSNQSLFALDKVDKPKQIIILNTCSYEFENAHLLVCAYKE